MNKLQRDLREHIDIFRDLRAAKNALLLERNESEEHKQQFAAAVMAYAQHLETMAEFVACYYDLIVGIEEPSDYGK